MMAFRHTTDQALRACGRGICAAESGHEGTCDEASGWADEPVVIPPAAARVIADIRKAQRRGGVWATGMPQLWEGDQA